MRCRLTKAVFLLVLGLAPAHVSTAQPVIKIPLWFSDESGLFTWSDSLRFGVHPAATSCIDDSLGEFFMFTECGLFSQHCAQFGRPPYRPCEDGDFPVFLDLRQYSSPGQSDTFAVGFVGTYPITVHWPPNLNQYFDSARVVDGLSFIFGLPQRLNVDMMTTDSAVIPDDTTGWFGLIILTHGPHLATEVDDGSITVPDKFILRQNYPNPFNPSTMLSYSIPKSSFVTLRVFDILGREVATLVEGIQDAGFKSVEWNATGMAGGVYFYRLRATELASRRTFVQTGKMVLLQ